jgi:uncharacterized membrane protein YhiD involved in acid resistance
MAKTRHSKRRRPLRGWAEIEFGAGACLFLILVTTAWVNEPRSTARLALAIVSWIGALCAAVLLIRARRRTERSPLEGEPRSR